MAEEKKYKGEKLMVPESQPSAEQRQPMSDEQWAQYKKEGAAMYGTDTGRTLTEDQVKKEAAKPQAPATPYNPLRVSQNPTAAGQNAGMNIKPGEIKNPKVDTNGAEHAVAQATDEKGWDYIINEIKKGKEYRLRTPEEIEKQRKRDKLNRIFAAIGDGVSSLANIYFATKGAPAVQYGKSLSEAQREASDRWWKDEKEQREAYLRDLTNAMSARQRQNYYNWRERSTADRQEATNQYRQDQIELQRDREERLKEDQKRKARTQAFNNSKHYLNVLAQYGRLSAQQQSAVQRWYAAAQKGNPGPFPNVSADVQQALIKQYPEAFEGVTFSQQAPPPANPPAVQPKPAKGTSKKKGSAKKKPTQKTPQATQKKYSNVSKLDL
jgi:hypothetical protein